MKTIKTLTPLTPAVFYILLALASGEQYRITETGQKRFIALMLETGDQTSLPFARCTDGKHDAHSTHVSDELYLTFRRGISDV